MAGKLILPGDPGFLTAENVNKLHSYDDVNQSAQAHHHTLGAGALQAAPGNHGHAKHSRGYDTGRVAPNINDIPVLLTEYDGTAPVDWGVFSGNTGARLNVAGFWSIHFHCWRTAGGLGARNWLRLKSTSGTFDPATIIAHSSWLPAAEDRMSVSFLGYLPKDVVIRFEFYQDSGGSTTVSGIGNVVLLG